VNDATRDARGRLLPGHHIGRPKGSRRTVSPVALALEAANVQMTEARKVLVEGTIEAARKGDVGALRLLASWLMPKARPLDVDLFRGARTPEQAQAAVLGGMAAGALSPGEAIEAGKVVAAYGEAGEWERLREIHEAAMRDGGKPRSLPAGPDDGPGRGEQ